MNEKRIKVLLADDTLIAREGWKRILETANDIEVVGEATNVHDTSKLVLECSPDVLLMDLKWFGDPTAGWINIKRIKSSHPSVKIIAITAYEELIKDAIREGADDALTKTFGREELLNLIREVVSREEKTVTPRTKPEHFPQDELSPRELDVLRLMIKGVPDKEIANTLNIALSTAKNHVKNILSKLGAKNRTEAASIARDSGILP